VVLPSAQTNDFVASRNKLAACFSMSNDPLLTLLRRYQAELEAFEPPIDCLSRGSEHLGGPRCREKEAAPAGCTVRIYNQGHGFSDWDVAILDPVIAKVVALDMAGLPINHRGRVRVTRYLTADDVQTLQLDSGEARKKHRNESPLSPPAGCGMGGLNFWGHDCQSVQPPRTIPPNSAQ
jgi:hypothetical protein